MTTVRKMALQNDCTQCEAGQHAATPLYNYITTDVTQLTASIDDTVSVSNTSTTTTLSANERDDMPPVKLLPNLCVGFRPPSHLSRSHYVLKVLFSGKMHL